MNYFHKFLTGTSEICVDDIFLQSRGVYAFTFEIAYTGNERSRIIEVYAVEGLCSPPKKNSAQNPDLVCLQSFFLFKYVHYVICNC